MERNEFRALTDPVEAFDEFIRRWVAPTMQAHLLDSDDNDAEFIRSLIDPWHPNQVDGL